MKTQKQSNKLIRGLLVCWALALIALTGCKKTDDSGAAAQKPADEAAAKEEAAPKVVKLAFVTNNAGEFWKIAQAGVKKYEKEAKVQVDVKMPPNGKVEEQNQILENLASQNYDAIAVSAIAPEEQVQKLNEVAEKSKLITFDSDAPKSKRLLYIGTNNRDAGKELGKKIVELLPDGGKIAIFVGYLSADNARERIEGVEEAIKDKKIEIVKKYPDEADESKARTNAEEAINAFQDLDMLVGIYAYNGPQIAEAIKAAGKKGKIKAAAFDEMDGTLLGIEEGVIAATVVQKPFQFGYLSSKWMHDLATKPEEAMKAIPANKAIDTGVQVITKDNVVQFKKDLAELKKVGAE